MQIIRLPPDNMELDRNHRNRPGIYPSALKYLDHQVGRRLSVTRKCEHIDGDDGIIGERTGGGKAWAKQNSAGRGRVTTRRGEIKQEGAETR